MFSRMLSNRRVWLILLVILSLGVVAARRRGPDRRPPRQDNGETTQETGQRPPQVNGDAQADLTDLFEVRTLDGSDNNLSNPTFGVAGLPFSRDAAAAYADDASAMEESPDPRYVSNRIYNDGHSNLFSENEVTHWGFVWGQFIDHTIGLRESGDEEMIFPFDMTDPLEEFTNDLGALAFTRSAAADGTGITTAREQVNLLPSYLDAFAVYGGTEERLDWLRVGPIDGDVSNNGAELFLTSDGFLPTRADRGDADAAPSMDLMGPLRMTPDQAVVAGDVRANENTGLTAVQTLFAREHNRIVDELPDNLTEELKFEIARRIVGATQQYITYQEFLPAFGVDLASYDGYDPTVDASVSNEFATVGYRAHSMIHGEFEMSADRADYTDAELANLEAQGIEVEIDGTTVEFAIPLNIAFGRPQLLNAIGLDPVLLGLASEAQYSNDETIDNQLRSVLFQIPAPGATNPAACLDGTELAQCYTLVNDLGVLDMMRAYDHGMPSYNEMRVAYGLAPRSSFTEVTGESTAAFPVDAEINAADPINDPDILDFVTFYDQNGAVLTDADLAAGELASSGDRRSTLAARLAAIYGSVDELDAFTGMMSEPHVAGTEFGELQLAMWTTQFTSLRDGDRFFYRNDPALMQIERQYGISFRQTLADVIANNTELNAWEVPDNVFVVE